MLLMLTQWLQGLSPELSFLRVFQYLTLRAVMAALTVSVAMRVVGVLLVSAVMIVPVAAAQLLTRSFRTTMHLAMGIGVVVSFSGLVITYVVDLSPGAMIVVLALACYALASVAAVALRRRRAAPLRCARVVTRVFARVKAQRLRHVDRRFGVHVFVEQHQAIKVQVVVVLRGSGQLLQGVVQHCLHVPLGLLPVG